MFTQPPHDQIVNRPSRTKSFFLFDVNLFTTTTGRIREREKDWESNPFFSLFSSLARSRKDTLIDLFLSGKIKSILQGQLISGNRIGLIATISLMSDHFSASLSFPTQKVSPQSGNCSMNQRFTHLRGFIWTTLDNEKMSIAILFAYEAIRRLGEQLSLSCASR